MLSSSQSFLEIMNYDKVAYFMVIIVLVSAESAMKEIVSRSRGSFDYASTTVHRVLFII